MNSKDLDKVWLPDTYFVNAKDSSFHYVTNENKLLQIGPQGLISYRIRLVEFMNNKIVSGGQNVVCMHGYRHATANY